MIALKQIFEQLGLSTENLPDISISGPAKLSEAQKNQISFLANLKYEHELYSTNAGAVLVSNDFEPKQAVSANLVRVEDPYVVITQLLHYFSSKEKLVGVDETAKVDASAAIGTDAFIGAFTFIGKNVQVGNNSAIHAQVYLGNQVSIGSNCIIYPGVKIYDNCIIGDSCIIHSGTVIGSDGFGFAPQKDGTYQKIPQSGNVLIHNNVEIGSNCSIDRATMGSTVIESGVKLDNLIQVGHNAVVGENTVIAAQAGVSGSTKLGKGCMIGGQVGFVGHISIAPFTLINAKSGISKSIKKEGSKVNGIPAFNFTDSLRSQSVYRRLPELEKKLQEIEEILSLLRK